MKWTLISKPANTLQEYHLVQDGAVKAVIKYNSGQQSVRINDNGTQRLLFIERRGFWNKQTLLKNEYGVNIGRLYKTGWDKRIGAIEIDGHHYTYAISQDNTLPELALYENDNTNPLATYNLQEASGFSITKDIQKYTNLLLGLCACMFSPRNVNPPGLQLSELDIL